MFTTELTAQESWQLKNLVLKEIGKTGLRVVEVWDDANLLTEWASNQIPYSNHPWNPKSAFNPTTGNLENEDSALTVACRIANDYDSISKTIFCGTDLRMTKVEEDLLDEEDHLFTICLVSFAVCQELHLINSLVITASQ